MFENYPMFAGAKWPFFWYNFYNETIGNRYVVVDLEATSTGSKAKIIQVGIVVIEDGEIVDHYTTDVNPHEPLDAHIKELTGLTDQRLAQAPDFSQVARKIFDLVEDGIFVAHNVQFDANLLAENLFFEGYELRNPRVDTVELAQVFFPELEKYSLPILCQELGIPLNTLIQPFQMPKLLRNYSYFYEKRWPNFLKVSWNACWKWLTLSYMSPIWLLKKFIETNLS